MTQQLDSLIANFQHTIYMNLQLEYFNDGEFKSIC